MIGTGMLSSSFRFPSLQTMSLYTGIFFYVFGLTMYVSNLKCIFVYIADVGLGFILLPSKPRDYRGIDLITSAIFTSFTLAYFLGKIYIFG